MLATGVPVGVVGEHRLTSNRCHRGKPVRPRHAYARPLRPSGVPIGDIAMHGVPPDEERPRKRCVRCNEPGHAHYLTFSCFHDLPLLAKDRPRTWFLQALGAAREKHEFHLWGYVVMPEHVHLLLCPRREDYSISTILHAIKRPTAYRALADLRERAPAFVERLTVRQGKRTETHFWQAGGGYDRNVTEPRAAHEMLEYVHNNPVRRGLAQTPPDWPWSSARFWEGWDDILLAMDRTLPDVSG